MLVHILSVFLIGMVLQSPSRVTGSMKVIVTGATDSIPVAGALVSLGYRIPHDAGGQISFDVAKKRTDSRGEAFFEGLLPGRYSLMVIIGKTRRTGLHIMAMATVFPDSLSTVRLPLSRASIQEFDDSPEFRMNVFPGDTSMEVKMPTYNPADPNQTRHDSLIH